MRILILSTVYPDIVTQFKEKIGEEKGLSYKNLKSRFDACFYNYDDSGLCDAFRENGVIADNFIINADCLQKSWEYDYASINTLNYNDIIISQIKNFKPDVLWFSAVDSSLLRYIRLNCPEIRLIIGWVGSAIMKTSQWKDLDIIFSCAQESVDYFNSNGLKAVQVHHSFNPKVLKFLKKEDFLQKNLVFIGQIVRAKEYHLEREKLLLGLKNFTNLKIYTPSYFFNYTDILKSLMKIILYKGVHGIKKTGLLSDDVIRYINILSRVNNFFECPRMPVNIELIKHFRKPVFGLEMFNILYNSDIVLNIHADSSPKYASNMRLFESTGVGACLLTDMKNNLNEIFDVSKEIVAYESLDDCIEKAVWLSRNPQKAKEIAEAGMKRCLKDHTYVNRMETILKVIRNNI